MKLEQFNTWLTLVANIGVIAGIVFLAFEVNQNTTALTIQANAGRTSELREFNFNAMNSDWFWPVLETLRTDIPDLTPFATSSTASVEDWEQALVKLSFEERGRFYIYVLTQWNNLQNIWLQHDAGLIDETLFTSFREYTGVSVTKLRAFGFTTAGDRSIDIYITDKVGKSLAILASTKRQNLPRTAQKSSHPERSP